MATTQKKKLSKSSKSTADLGFRHIFVTTPRSLGNDEGYYTNLKINHNGGSSKLIKASSRIFIVPYESQGTLQVHPLSMKGKQTVIPKLIRAHSQPLLDFDIHPFNDGLIATCSRESAIKLWSLPKSRNPSSIFGLLSEDLTIPATELLYTSSNRVLNVQFHPLANNILHSVHGDNSINLWDINDQAPFCTLKDHNDSIESTAWSGDGSLLATACKDKILRLYDPRANAKPIQKVENFCTPKGARISWAGTDTIMSISFKEEQRAVSLWNLSESKKINPNLKNPFYNSPLDSSSALLTPYYHEGTGVSILAGKGNTMFFTERSKKEPYLTLVGKESWQGTRLDFCPIPQTICNVKECEIMRFLVVNDKTSVESLSIVVPRKNKDYFQEDLYGAVPSSEPTISAKSWKSGKDVAPKLENMKPQDMLSVYEVDIEMGGRSKIKDMYRSLGRRSGNPTKLKIDQLYLPSTIEKRLDSNQDFKLYTEGEIFLEVQGWMFRSFKKRFLRLKKDTIHCFEAEDSALPTESIPFNVIDRIVSSDENQVIFVIKTKGDTRGNLFPEYSFSTYSVEEKEMWIFSLDDWLRKQRTIAANPNSFSLSRASSFRGSLSKRAANPFLSNRTKPSATKPSLMSLFDKDDNEEKTNSNNNQEENPEEFMIKGYIHLYTEGLLYNYWTKFYAKTEEEFLELYTSESSEIKKQQIHLDNVDAITPTDAMVGKKYTFQIFSPQRVLYFACENENERTQWTTKLNKIRSLVVTENVEKTEDSQTKHFSGFCHVREGTLGMWWKYWVVALGETICTYKGPLSLTPEKKIQISSIVSVDKSSRDKDFALQISVKNNQRTQDIIHFKLTSQVERDQWQKILSKLQVNSQTTVNLLKELKLDNVPETANNIYQLDLTLLKKGQQKLLIRVRGRRKNRIEVVPLSTNSLDSKSVFVLDGGRKLYQWNGKKSNRICKGKGTDVISTLKQKDRQGVAEYYVLEDEQEDALPKESLEFWKALVPKGQEPKRPSKIQEGPNDEEPPLLEIDLYRVSEDTVFYLQSKGSARSKNILDSKFCYVLWNNANEIYIWIGKEANPQARVYATQLATKIAIEYKEWIVLTKILDGGEISLFKAKFTDYPGMLPIAVSKQAIISNVARAVVQEKIDSTKFFVPSLPPPSSLPQKGTVTVYRCIENQNQKWELSEYPKEYYGHFFSEDCYCISFEYKKSGTERDLQMIYFWQGRDASRTEIGASAYLTKDLDEKIGGSESQVRVQMNMERDHFLKMFDFFIVHTGSFKRKDKLFEETRLYEIRGTTNENTRAVQVSTSAGNLNTCHSFLLIETFSIMIWNGLLSNKFEIETTSKLCQQLKEDKEVLTFKEKSENKDFWQILGEKTSYFDTFKTPRKDPRLFIASGESGTVKIEEVWDITQDSLDINNVMILDANSDIYIWFGIGSKANTQKIAMETFIEYSRKSKNHPTDCRVTVIKQGSEPKLFTSYFRAWSVPKYQIENQSWFAPATQILKEYARDAYAYDELRNMVDMGTLPKSMDSTKLENYLDDEEFSLVFEMERETFDQLPKWRQEKLKKDVCLF